MERFYWRFLQARATGPLGGSYKTPRPGRRRAPDPVGRRAERPGVGYRAPWTRSPSKGSSSGRLGGRPSPEERPVRRRPIHGSR
ncbi:hypothetical protein GCM10009601_39310 [Streptomyces thermospinosisporus]|uniref:Uncharacterized protein n=1 Tax=Streptomyces thermospinosisporus TaxID=161482 RepID=A0ABN1Z1K0_9ACTN